MVMNSNIYVITHKKLHTKVPKDRKLLMVGAYNKETYEGYLKDSIGENISEKNPNYCELTGLYWMWKNDKADIIGLEHYRRFFITKFVYLFKFPSITNKKVEKILGKYDVILPKRIKLKKTVIEHYSKYHNKKDMIEIGKIIKDKYPEYINSFWMVMNGKYSYNYNMFIGKRNIMDGYCEWLFSILEELENRIDVSSLDSYQARIFGFISERLMAVYMLHHNIKIREMRVEFINGNKLKTQLSRLKTSILGVRGK